MYSKSITELASHSVIPISLSAATSFLYMISDLVYSFLYRYLINPIFWPTISHSVPLTNLWSSSHFANSFRRRRRRSEVRRNCWRYDYGYPYVLVVLVFIHTPAVTIVYFYV